MKEKRMASIPLPGPGGLTVDVEIFADDCRCDTHEIIPIYEEDFATQWLKAAILRWIDHGFDAIMLITGERRIGKSTIAQKIARSVDKDFPQENIAFEMAEIEERLERLPFADPRNNIYPQLIIDEAGWDLYSGNWMKEMSKLMVRKLEVIGKKRIVIYFVLPHRGFLLKGLRDTMGRYWLNAEQVDMERGYCEVRQATPNKWRLDAYWSPLCFFRFSDAEGPFWNEYEKRKQDFIDRAMKERTKEKNRYDKYFASAISGLQKQTGESNRAICERLGMPESTFYDRMKRP